MISTKDFKKCRSFLTATSLIEQDVDVKISTDTRELSNSNTFLAIEGENFNPLKFLDQLINTEIKLIIYTQNPENEKIIDKYLDKFNFIKTKDSIVFLQEITTILSKRFQNNGGKLIAISGSNGKTTTKEMLYFILSATDKKIICTQKNNNNHIGVPLTLLQIDHETDYAVVELGSNHPGEIKTLCKICVPRIGVTTNIGDTHLEFFENRKNVFKEEGFLFHQIQNDKSSDKIYFCNADDEFLKKFSNHEISLSYGLLGKDYQFNIENSGAIIQNRANEYKINNKFITGKHNFFNLCLGFSIAKEIDPENEQLYVEAACQFKPTANRSQWLTLNNSNIFLDAYNANPSSMILAIEGFVETVPEGKSYCLILGDMNELGKNAADFHTQLSKELNSKGFENFYFVGKHAHDYDAGCGNKGSCFETTSKLAELFEDSILEKFDYIFIKGSRSLQLESLMDINKPL